ncbi:MAG: hypothetical protein KAI47_20945 [Deltaproteobacteria bacterium]|nr:hypothetical protein [Deltaproteobacteria bacterium]
MSFKDDPKDDEPVVDWAHRARDASASSDEEDDRFPSGDEASTEGLWNKSVGGETSGASVEDETSAYSDDGDTSSADEQPLAAPRPRKKRRKKKEKRRKIAKKLPQATFDDHGMFDDEVDDEVDDSEEADPASDEATLEPRGRLVGRGFLMLMAAGYLFFMAALSYQALGSLHAEARGAVEPQLTELQKTHEQIHKLTLGNAAGGAIFGLAGLLLLFGRRGLGKTLIFFGTVFLIGFLYIHFKEAQPYLRDLDFLIKLIILSLASLSI